MIELNERNKLTCEDCGVDVNIHMVSGRALMATCGCPDVFARVEDIPDLTESIWWPERFTQREK